MKHITQATILRLSATYLGLIMVLSVGFSVALYNTSSQAIGQQLPPNSMYINQFGESGGGFNNFFRDRISEGRHEILMHLIILNILSLVVGAGLSYLLALRSLEPIEEAMESQARFSSDASHELRTPLTAIRARNEVALRKPELSLSDAKDVITSNLDEAIKLERLSDGLLRLSRGNNNLSDPKPVKLSEIATEAMNQFIEPAQAKKITIEDTMPDLSVIGDRDGLKQVIAILLDNAIKYSSSGSSVTIAGKKKQSFIELSVADNGPGIRASDIPHIFDRFYRADSSRARKGENGYGLGLSIAKQIVDQHDGEIIANSTLGKGTTFIVKLPINET